MVILTLNCGSSSTKYQVYHWDKKEVLGLGYVERIGQEESTIVHTSLGKESYRAVRSCSSHKEAVEWIMQVLSDPKVGYLDSMDAVKAVGHRVVHGGEKFTRSVTLTEDVLKELRAVSPLAPLHNPANLIGIQAAQAILPQVPHCAIMDTAWHQTMPASSYMYALPYHWYTQHNVRRYGFHGTSYLYIAKRAAVLLGKEPKETNLIIAHIGNGASVCAVKGGVSIDTSMGMTPLEGLIMGTRSGDFDPAITSYIMRRENLSPIKIDNILNKRSGILGITENLIDRRDVQKGVMEGNERCLLAQNMETYRIRKYLGAYYAAVGRLDAIVFTAGVGEMNPSYRLGALSGLESMNIVIDKEKNEISRTRNAETCISSDDSPVKIFVIPTDEELVMAEDTYALSQGNYDFHTDFHYNFQDKNYRNKARDRLLAVEIKKNRSLDKILALPLPVPTS